MKSKQDTIFYDQYQYPRLPKAAIDATRARLLQGLGTKVQSPDEPTDQSVRIHISTPVLRSQQNRKLGRMRMAEPSRKSTPKGMPAPSRAVQVPAKKPRDAAESSNPHRTPELARLTISQRKMEHHAHVTGVQLVAKQDESVKSMKLVSLEAYKDGRDFKLSTTTRPSAREAKRQRMKNSLKFIIDLAVRRRNSLRGAQPASPLLQVPDARRKPRKRMPESTFAPQPVSSSNLQANDTADPPEYDPRLVKGRASSQVEPPISKPPLFPVPLPPPILDPSKKREREQKLAAQNGTKEAEEEEDKKANLAPQGPPKKCGNLKLTHTNSVDNSEPLPQILLPQPGSELPTPAKDEEKGHSLSPVKHPNWLHITETKKRPRRNTASVESNPSFARSMEELALSRLIK